MQWGGERSDKRWTTVGVGWGQMFEAKCLILSHVLFSQNTISWSDIHLDVENAQVRQLLW